MPTYQSSPYMPWVFPDEAYHMNYTGIKPLRPVPLRNKYDLLPGGGSEAQTLFDNHDRKVALDRVHYNKKKEEGMLGHRNTTARSQRYDRPASRSAVPNGIFHGSPMEYVTSSGLRGGVITTKEGQEWLAKRLKQRAQEYAEISSGNFSARPSKIDVSPYNTIDTLLQSAFTAFTAGSFSPGLNETLNQLLQAFIRAGATITPSQLTTYSQAVQQMMVASRAYDGTFRGLQRGIAFEADEKKLRNVDAINVTLRVINAAIQEIARVIYEPMSSRQQVMNQLASRLLAKQISQFRPGFLDEGQELNLEAVQGQPLELGRVPGQTTELLPPQPAAPPPEDVRFPEEGFYGDLNAIGERAGLGRRRRHRF